MLWRIVPIRTDCESVLIVQITVEARGEGDLRIFVPYLIPALIRFTRDFVIRSCCGPNLSYAPVILCSCQRIL